MDQEAKKMMEYDIRGQICPSTLLIALREMSKFKHELKNGEVKLCFKTDNRNATLTIPDSARDMGYSVTVQKETDCYLIIIG